VTLRVRPWASPSAIVLGLVLASSTAVASAAAPRDEPVPCPDTAAVVRGAEAPDFSDVCRGVAAAIAFFARHGVRPTEPVSIEVTRTLPPEAGPTASGCYIERKRRVFVLPYALFRKSKTWFGVPIDRAMYRALASHEAAHAIAACSFSIPNPTIQAKEYLAYVAMFATMPPDLRNKVLRITRTEGFDRLERFTPLLYMFDPMRFGAEAYRHFSKAPDPSSVVREILGGKVLLD
jgi:hypothetical protein